MSLAWMKKGEEAEAALEEAEAKQTQSEGGSDEFYYRFRYWMPNDAENKITFLDGDLTENGVLEKVAYMEHQKQIGGDWKNFFPCTADTEPCPLCAAGDNVSFVAVFTVIDHSEWKDKKGNVHRNEKRLYVVKKDTLKLLQKMAIKRGGLRGCTFDVSRTGDKSASVGSHFDFDKKFEDLSEFAVVYGLEDVEPLDYEKVIQYKTAEELRDMGLGASGSSIGGEPETDVDVSKDL